MDDIIKHSFKCSSVPIKSSQNLLFYTNTYISYFLVFSTRIAANLGSVVTWLGVMFSMSANVATAQKLSLTVNDFFLSGCQV